jgi:hypothetical protein
VEPGRFPQPPTGDPGASLASRYDDDLGDAVAYPTTSDRESGWFRGTGGAGTVHVRIDRTTTDARVELHRGWRAAVGPQLLAPAVLEALHGASFARLAAVLHDRTGARQLPPDRRGLPELSLRESAERARRAHQDLHEFRLQLAALARQPRNVAGPGRHAVVVVLNGQVVDLALDPAWRRTAIDSDLEHRITDGLRRGLRECAALHAQALDGCPDLVEVLADARGAPLSPLAEQLAGRLRGGR